jgi:Holliday junction DNA helicase RuvA
MIGFLSGQVKAVDRVRVLIDTGKVGYWVTVSPSLLTKLQPQSDCELFIHTHVREDALNLFGFSSLSDLKLFEQLITVSGVGPKLALNVFAAGSSASITQAIESADQSFFTAVSGIGKKNAQRLIIDLKGKVGGLGQELDLSGSDADLAKALTNLGFSQAEIREVLPKIDRSATSEGQLKSALKILGL